MALAQSGATPADLYYLLGTRVQSSALMEVSAWKRNEPSKQINKKCNQQINKKCNQQLGKETNQANR